MTAAAAIAVCVAACGSSSTPSTSTQATASGVAGPPVVVPLGDQPSGTVMLSWDPQTKNVTAKLQMVGFTPGSSHAMHIHQGSCAAQGDVLVPFPDVTANDGGAIDTTVTARSHLPPVSPPARS
jgi:Cu/Zn superoxide dismutase